MLYLPFKDSGIFLADCDVGKIRRLFRLFCNNSKIQWTVNETSSTGDQTRAGLEFGGKNWELVKCNNILLMATKKYPQPQSIKGKKAGKSPWDAR